MKVVLVDPEKEKKEGEQKERQINLSELNGRYYRMRVKFEEGSTSRVGATPRDVQNLIYRVIGEERVNTVYVSPMMPTRGKGGRITWH